MITLYKAFNRGHRTLPKKSRPTLPKSNLWHFGHYFMKVHTLTTKRSEQTYLSEKVPCYEAMKFCCFLATRDPNGLRSITVTDIKNLQNQVAEDCWWT